MTYQPLTRNERRQQAATFIALCETVRKRLGDGLLTMSDAQVGRAVSADELPAAMWLRDVVTMRGERQ